MLVVVDLGSIQHIDAVQLHVKNVPLGLTSIKAHATAEYGKKWNEKVRR